MNSNSGQTTRGRADRGKAAAVVGGSRQYTRGLYFGPKTIFIPPPFWKWYFFPLSRHVVFRLPSWPFCLNSSLFCNYFTLLLPLFSFSFPFLPFLSLFYLLLLHFPSFFSSPFSYFFPQMTSADISRGGEYFPIYTCNTHGERIWSSLGGQKINHGLLVHVDVQVLVQVYWHETRTWTF